MRRFPLRWATGNLLPGSVLERTPEDVRRKARSQHAAVISQRFIPDVVASRIHSLEWTFTRLLYQAASGTSVSCVHRAEWCWSRWRWVARRSACRVNAARPHPLPWWRSSRGGHLGAPLREYWTAPAGLWPAICEKLDSTRRRWSATGVRDDAGGLAALECAAILTVLWTVVVPVGALGFALPARLYDGTRVLTPVSGRSPVCQLVSGLSEAKGSRWPCRGRSAGRRVREPTISVPRMGEAVTS
jgi:hypothetical protein